MTRVTPEASDHATDRGRRLLLLSSQQAFIDHLPNLGDRALFAGLLTLIERHGGGGPLIHAPWKPFSHLTRKALERSGLEPAAALARWAVEAGHYPAWRVRAEHAAARLLDQPLASGLAKHSGFADLVRRRTGEPWNAPLRSRLRARRAEEIHNLHATADAALYSAAGLFADHLSSNLPARLFEAYLAARQGLPLAVINYSLSVAAPVNLALARAVLPLARVHLVREPRSRDALLALGIPPERIITSVDSAFANAAPARALPAERSAAVAVAVRGDRAADLTAWAELVEALRVRHGVAVHYIAGDWRHDPPVRRALGKRCRLADDGQLLDLAGVQAKLATMGLVITDRYHSAVFAAQTATPVLPIASTTHKTQGLFDLIDYPLPVLPPLTRSLVPLYLERIEQALGMRAALSARLGAFNSVAQQRLDDDYAALFRQLWDSAH